MDHTQLVKLVSTIAAHSRATLAVTLFASAAAITVLACGWDYLSDRSVRFNSDRIGRGFYRLPPLPIMLDEKTGKELSVQEVESFFEYETYETPGQSEQPEPAEMHWQNARAALQAGDLEAVKRSLRGYLDKTGVPMVNNNSGSQFFRNSAFDMMDALSELNRGARPASVKQYLEARSALRDGPIAESGILIPDGDLGTLKDNWEYLQAAALSAKERRSEALSAFRDHASKYPHSEKNESVRYMIAKLTMESSYSFGNMKCGIMGRKAWGDEEIDPATVEPVEKCRDDNWQWAVIAFQRMIRDHPKGRYVNDARGWLACLYRRGSERAKALAEYYRLLGHPTDRAARLEAKKSLQMIGHEYDDETLDQVEDLITPEPDAALAYAYHRIYNQAIDFTYEEPNSVYCPDGTPCWSEEEEERKRVETIRQKGNHELKRVARFATAMMQRHPHARVSGAFALRVAEAQLELRDFPAARDLARKALSLGLQGDLRAEALWVEGSARHHLKELEAARIALTRLTAEFPKSKLTEGARRLLAMTAEDRGDLETALDIYFDLGYDTDVAYFVDVLFSTDRLAGYVKNRENSPHRNKLLYALGVRYMRDGRSNDARRTLQSVRTEKGIDHYLDSDPSKTWYFSKEPVYGDEKGVIKSSWVMQDLKTIDILEQRQQMVDRAVGDEARAEAMYQLASAYYEADDLVFYNPSLWSGGRTGALGQLQFSDRVRLAGEDRIIFEHLQQHDPWARSIPIYEEIVTRFPQSQSAPDALYSAAVAHDQLRAHISPWTEIYRRGLFAGTRLVTYGDVESAYPKYQLPRGTDGWEPAARTVNGGPGWAPKPKPARPLSRTQKFERRLKYASEKIKLWVSPWVTSFTGKVSSVFNGYIAVITEGLSWLLWIVGVFLSAYFALLAVHFRVQLLAAARRIAGPAIPDEILGLPDSSSRVEKVIDQKEPSEDENMG